MWYHVIDWADQESVVSVTSSSNDTRVCVSSYKGLNHHFEVIDKKAFFDDLMSEQVAREVTSSVAKNLIKGLALESIEQIFANDLG